MDLTNDTGHLGLAYVAAVRRQGGAVTVMEFEAYMARPGPRPAVPERRERQTSPGVAAFLEQISGPGGLASTFLRSILAGVETPEVVVAEARPAETVNEWLTRLGWLRIVDGRILITQLGEAVLAHLEQTDVEVEIPVALTLRRDDELARARVFAKIAELGPAALVDPYFSMEGLLQVVQSTRVDRVLTSGKSASKVAGLEVALAGLSDERTVEVRKSDAFHDRLVLSDQGPVWMLGTSLTGVGKHLSIMVEIGDGASRGALRSAFDEAWQAAELVGQVGHMDSDQESQDSDDSEANEGLALADGEPAPT